MGAFKQKELIDEGRENLVTLTEMQLGEFVRAWWEGYVEDVRIHDGCTRDVVYDTNWVASKIRIANKMKHLRLLVLFTADLDIDEDEDEDGNSDRKEVRVESCVRLSFAVGTNRDLTPAQAEFTPCGDPLHEFVYVDATEQP